MADFCENPVKLGTKSKFFQNRIRESAEGNGDWASNNTDGAVVGNPGTGTLARSNGDLT
jgi:hypothetical protein